jgi:hypothetical protein
MGEGGSHSEPGEGILVEDRPHPAFGHLLPKGEGLVLFHGSSIGDKADSQVQ